MSKIKVLLAWVNLCIASTLAFFGCTRGFYFDDARIPYSELPRVLLIDPADGLKNVPVNAKVGILFSDPMNVRSVANSLMISVGGVRSAVKEDAWSVFDKGRLFIYDDADLIFPTNTGVTITLSTAAMDLDGYHMEKAVECRFTTSLNPAFDTSPPSVDESKPANEEVVNLDSAVSFEFTEGMMRGTVERSFLLQSHGGSAPDSRDYRNGRFVWDGRKMLYIPDEPLKMNDAQYEVSLNNNDIPCRDIAGNIYPDGTPILNFYTISENVIYVSSSGSDAYEGTNKDKPKATISGAVQAAQTARTLGYDFNVIKVAVGDYVDTAVLIDDIAVYGGYQPGFGSEVRANGSRVFASPSAPEAFLISGANGCTFDRLEIHGPASGQQKPCAVSIGGNSSNITIQNCTITGTDSSSPAESVGISIVNSSDIRIRDNSISGGRGTTSSTGVSVTGNGPGISISENTLIEGCAAGSFSNNTTGIILVDALTRVVGNLTIRGGSGSRNVGVSISGNLNRSVIEANDLIRGGEAGEVIGIEIYGGATPDILSNGKIIGGSAATATTHGIRVSGQANPRIARNLVIGGTITGGTGNAYGVYYDNNSPPPFSCGLFNNFILGGEQSSNRDASCCGVYVKNTNVSIVNNTIDGGGHYDGSQVPSGNTYGIYAIVDTPDWNITPLIINNYIIGGNGSSSIGIRLYSDHAPLGCEIFNNVFNFSDSVTGASYLGIGTNNISSIGAIAQLNGSTGGSFITPAPQNNIRDTFSVISTFVDWIGADFHVNSSGFGTVSNKGYTGAPSGVPPATLYGQPEVLLDIDRVERYVGIPPDYSLVDLGADEVQ